MPGLTAGRRDAALNFAYQTVEYLPHTGRDHGRFVSEDGDHGHRVSDQWSPSGMQNGRKVTMSCCGADACDSARRQRSRAGVSREDRPVGIFFAGGVAAPARTRLLSA
jgi:hypothetical protein